MGSGTGATVTVNFPNVYGYLAAERHVIYAYAAGTWHSVGEAIVTGNSNLLKIEGVADNDAYGLLFIDPAGF